jgi:chemotaxis protein CheX
MNDLLNKSLEAATKDVLKSVLDWDVDSHSPVEKRINEVDANDTSVFISIVGEISGAITMKCSNLFASHIASEMLGMPIEAGSDDMKDAVGELLNMIVGNAKTYYASNGNDPFKISIPTTIVGEDYTIYIKASPSDVVTQIDFVYNGQTLSFTIHLN